MNKPIPPLFLCRTLSSLFSLPKRSLACRPEDFSKFVNMPPEEWREGTVVSLMNYGAFVRLEEGVDGMVHISQMDPQGQRVDSVYDAMQVLQTKIRALR